MVEVLAQKNLNNYEFYMQIQAKLESYLLKKFCNIFLTAF